MRIGKAKQEISISIKRARKRKGWTQKETADRAGIPLTTYKTLERLADGSLENFVKIVGLLGSIDTLAALFPEPKFENLEDALSD